MKIPKMSKKSVGLKIRLETHNKLLEYGFANKGEDLFYLETYIGIICVSVPFLPSNMKIHFLDIILSTNRIHNNERLKIHSRFNISSLKNVNYVNCVIKDLILNANEKIPNDPIPMFQIPS